MQNSFRRKRGFRKGVVCHVLPCHFTRTLYSFDAKSALIPSNTCSYEYTTLSRSYTILIWSITLSFRQTWYRPDTHSSWNSLISANVVVKDQNSSTDRRKQKDLDIQDIGLFKTHRENRRVESADKYHDNTDTRQPKTSREKANSRVRKQISRR